MSLIELRQLVRSRPQISLNELAAHFKVSENQIESMMMCFVNKHQVTAKEVQSKCSSCACCSAKRNVIYSWCV